MEIGYEKSKTGLLLTICPFDIFRQRKVGSSRCQKCKYCLKRCEQKRKVICKHP